MQEVLALRVQQLLPVVLHGEVDDLSPDDHDEDEVLEDVHEQEVVLLVVPGECHLLQVLHLLDVVVIIGNVPTERLAHCEQELGIGRHRDETRRIGVEDGPDDPEVLGKV